MHKTIQKSILAIGLVTLSSVAAAAEWSGSASLGYLASQGNSDTANLNAGLDLSAAYGKWEHGIRLAAFSASEDDEQSAERYEARFKSTYAFSERLYGFGALGFDKDLFGGVNERTSETVGLGWKALVGERHKLDFEVGAGARQLEFADETTENDFIGRASADYRLKLSDTAGFRQYVGVETGSENTYAESITALTAQLNTALSLSVSYTVKHNSDIPDTVEHHSDSYTAISLNYAFK